MKRTSFKNPEENGGSIFSYIVTHDTGFAPNPFFGYCTLACCKPVIRKSARVGDWVVALTPKALGNCVVYFMRVDEVVPTFDAYWKDQRFAEKKPLRRAVLPMKCGDNVYEPQQDDSYRKLPSTHTEKEMKRPQL